MELIIQDYTLYIKQKENGLSISMYGLDKKEKLRLGLVLPNLYLYMDNKWIHIKNSISDKIAEIVNLTNSEKLFIEAVCYDLVNNHEITWIVNADRYLLSKDEIVAERGVNKCVYLLPDTDIRHNLRQITRNEPKMIISPLGSPVPILAELKPVRNKF